MIKDEIHQKIREDPQELFEKVETNNNPSAPFCKIQEDIQPQEKLPQKRESSCFPIQRKHKRPPPLTEREINQILSTTALPSKENNHKETKEHVVVKIIIPPKKTFNPMICYKRKKNIMILSRERERHLPF